jgi:hypothetical protein
MNRRPWPIVLMAFLQFLSPFLYVGVAALFYHLSFSATMNEILALTPELRKFEIFALPILIGVLILMTKRTGYYFVIVGSVYSIVRGVMEYVASNETDPVFPLVISNLLCLLVVAILLRPKTRSVYFNPRLRWWETSPRFVVDFPATITRTGGAPSKAVLQNVATGGGGVETTETGFLKEEIVSLEFRSESESYRFRAKVVWEKEVGARKQLLGVQWADDNSSTEWSKLRRLLRGLKSKGARTTRAIPPRLSEVKEWFSKLAG